EGEWLYVQLVNYRGWLRGDDVALAAGRQAWQARRALPFVVITGTKVAPRDAVMGKPVADWRAGMGAKLPFFGMKKEGYQVEIPRRDAQGAVIWQKAWIHGKADVSVGYLPYTRANILRQAFKMLGEHYGWGGLNEGRDCSSFIMDIYNVFGIRAPRNADQQEAVPGRRIVLRGIGDVASRYALLTQASPGATLHMRNHVMLYLGEHNGKHYAIHSLGSYGDASRPRSDGSLPRIGVMQIVVGDLDLPLRSGRRFIEVLTSVNNWQP
ncbi:MAG: C40 family peptidase, partial [Negativicutes bacterium]|nr:C40 family peptidase [Negativicutes bacterium]